VLFNQTATVPPHDVAALLQENAELKRQLASFKQQMFGRKSEARPVEPNPHQLPLEGLMGDPVAPLPEIEMQSITYQRGKAKKQRSADCATDSGLRFGVDVPIKTIVVSVPELNGPNADQYDVIDIRKTYRLAQRPASYEVLCYERPVLKCRATTKMITTPAPANVLDHSLADVSFLASR
jgi:transposase